MAAVGSHLFLIAERNIGKFDQDYLVINNN